MLLFGCIMNLVTSTALLIAILNIHRRLLKNEIITKILLAMALDADKSKHHYEIMKKALGIE